MSLQTKLARRHATLKKKLYDNDMERIGLSMSALHISIVKNKYGDEDFTIGDAKKITGYIDYPGQEFPAISKGGDTNNQSILHLYDVLPIEAYFKHEDGIQLGDIISQRIDVDDNDDYWFHLQVVDVITRASTSVIWKRFIVAPYTLQLEKYPELETIFDSYKTDPDL